MSSDQTKKGVAVIVAALSRGFSLAQTRLAPARISTDAPCEHYLGTELYCDRIFH